MAKGRKTGGGSRKGIPNKTTLDVADKLARLKCDPIEGMARIALGDVPCPLCQQTGEVTLGQLYTHYGAKTTLENLEAGTLDTIHQCPVCGGSGFDPVSTQIRLKSYSELAQYVAPKRKAVEVTGKDGEALPQLVIGSGVRG